MRISELSRETGVPIATIKFYLRERLLPPGRSTGRNQAQYGSEHCRRLRLIRALTNIGQLDLSTVRTLIDVIEDDQIPLLDLYQAVDRILFTGGPVTEDNRDTSDTDAHVDAFIATLGWRISADAPGLSRLVQVLDALKQLGCESGTDILTPYAEAAERLAISELDLLSFDGDSSNRGPVVARAVLLNEALAAMRQLAREHHVGHRFGYSPPAPRP
ncbi:MerR family transcriptional regulator [Micromonospora sediminicola]|uniref:MerR family transcriptional regulator n=1 Tax=Micromonospora sediminicola TaxID=946078 RepID=UPI0033E3852E